MKMKVLSLMMAVTMGLSVNVFASEIDTNMLDRNYNTIIIDEDGNISYDNVAQVADDTATPDNPQARSRVNVTASDVWRVTNEFGNGPEYYARGYVTAREYHYAEAEMWYNGSLYTGGFNRYGTGKVYAQSNDCFGPNATARIFYGA